MPNEETKWVALELSPHGERVASDGTLKKLLMSSCGIQDEESLFVPYVSMRKNGEDIIVNVMEGYIFVDSSLGSDVIGRIVRSYYVSRTVSFVRGGYGTVPNSSVESLKSKLGSMVSSNLSEGQAVRVNGGPLCGVTGVLVSKGEDESCLRIKMRSIEAIRAFRNYLLEPL